MARGCPATPELHESHALLSPGDLTRTIGWARAGLASGSLVLDAPSRRAQSVPSQVPFEDLPERGPWPDYLEYAFRCVLCGGLFRLVAETYHGRGGEWAVAPPRRDVS